MGKYQTELNDANIDIVFTPQINNWNGSPSIQLKMKDVSIIP
jgi:single-stranded-DNA-specific exonuclease